MRPFRRRAERRTSVSRNTSPVWYVACARSPPRAHAPSGSAGSGPLPSGTTRGANAASQSDAGFLQRDNDKDYVQSIKKKLGFTQLLKIQALSR